VKGVLPFVPVNGLESCVVGRFVEEFQNRGDLSEFVSAVVGVGSQSKSVQPLVCEIVILLCVVDNCSLAWSGSSGHACSLGIQEPLAHLLS
jgi:hypothetical protein